MIYDTPIDILVLPDTIGTPIQGKLERKFSAYCGGKTVYHSRYWESIQAGSRIDSLVQLPLHRDVSASMFARYKGHIYSIEQVQLEYDNLGLPVTILSLKREEANYDIAGV